MRRLPAASQVGERSGTAFPLMPINDSRASFSVLVLSAQKGFREDVAAALRREGLQATAVATMYEWDAVLAVCGRRPDAVILGRPLASAASGLCEALAAHAPSSTLVVLSDVLDDASVAAVLRAGASGYFRDDVEAPVLAAFVRRVIRDDRSATAFVRPDTSSALAAS